jgi:hypothetical protein
MPLILGALAVLGLVALAKNPTAVRAPAPADPDAALTSWILARYADIGRILGWGLPPIVITTLPSVTQNAASDGERILVNVRWVRELLETHCNDLPCRVVLVVGVLVHELTHHIYQDARVPYWAWPQRRQGERRADFASAVVVASLGLDVAHLERALSDPLLRCDPHHGCPWERVATVREGAAYALRRALREAA